MKTSHFFISFFLIFFSMENVNGQSAGKVEYKYLGYSFVIPEGWIGREIDNRFLIGSHTIPGFAIISAHQEKNIEALKIGVQQGFQDEKGTSLVLSGPINNFSDKGISAELSGTMEWAPVKAFVISLASPYGNGLNIMAAASQAEYAQVHVQLAQQLAESVKFTEPEVSPIMEEWKQALSNAKLTYMDSYYSPGGVNNDGYVTGGGYNTNIEIHLCAQGFFKYKNSSRVGIDTGGAFGNSYGNSNGDGLWDIIGNAQGGAVLHLKFNNGETTEYNLTNQGSNIFLNGKKYYRTFGNDNPEYAPECF